MELSSTPRRATSEALDAHLWRGWFAIAVKSATVTDGMRSRSQVHNRLAAGGSRIRTLGSAETLSASSPLSVHVRADYFSLAGNQAGRQKIHNRIAPKRA